MKKTMKMITADVLKKAGFEYLEKESDLLKECEENYGICNFKIFKKWTDDANPIKLEIDNGFNNRGTAWHLHIDNDLCQTIGSADIDTIDQFNKLMEIFNSKFRLS